MSLARPGSSLIERVTVHAPIETVWSVISDPGMLPRWNPKVVRVMPEAIRAPGQGYRFRLTQRFGRRIDTRLVEIVHWSPPRELELESTGGGLPSGHRVREIWTLETRGDSTVVRQSIDLSESGISLPWRVAIALLHRIGKPAGGDRYLDVMRELIEGGHLAESAGGNAASSVAVQ